MHKILNLSLIIFLLLSYKILAQYERPGSTDGQFLKIGISPRGTAMGDAYIAVVEGAEATFYNSAALGWLEGTDMVFNHTFWFADINHDFASLAHSFGDLGTFGLSVIALYTDEMKVRTPLQPDGTGETFYAGNYKIGLTYARHFTDKVTFGLTVGYIRLSLYKDFDTDAVSLDIAAMYKSDFRGFNFALQISNFGSEIKFVNESYPLPTNFTFGAGINIIEANQHNMLLSVSASKPNDGSPFLQAGMEYNFNDLLFLRGGYRFNHDVAKYSLGGGVKFNINQLNLRADYSFSDYSLLGNSHRIGLGILL